MTVPVNSNVPPNDRKSDFSDEDWRSNQLPYAETLKMPRQCIGLTMGDPAGVGPELMLRALCSPLAQQFQLVLFGHWGVLERCRKHLAMPEPKVVVLSQKEYQELSSTAARTEEHQADGAFPSIVVDHAECNLSDFEPGRLSAQCGEASFQFIESAILAALSNKIDAIATGPINKEALHMAGHYYPGHTEIFAERAAWPIEASNTEPAGTIRGPWCMMQYSPTITCTFVTVHCGYAQVPQLLTTQRVLDTILLTASAVQRIRGGMARLIVCGLNPHAGEHGLFGDREEERIIQPAVELARQRGVNVEGPLPPDTVFIPSKLKSCDAVVCMYHDQGHIPVKALAFDSAVNTTLGLQIIRTSVDHGTAFDIAWQGVAKPDSLFAAIRLAGKLAGHDE